MTALQSTDPELWQAIERLTNRVIVARLRREPHGCGIGIEARPRLEIAALKLLPQHLPCGGNLLFIDRCNRASGLCGCRAGRQPCGCGDRRRNLARQSFEPAGYALKLTVGDQPLDVGSQSLNARQFERTGNTFERMRNTPGLGDLTIGDHAGQVLRDVSRLSMAPRHRR